MLHQLDETDPIVLEPEEDEDQGVYGGGSDDCMPGLSGVTVSIVGEGDDSFVGRIIDAALSVDIAIQGDNYVLAMPGAEPGKPTVKHGWLFEECTSFVGEGDEEDDDEDWDYGQVTSVRYHDDGRTVMFSREPARVLIQAHPTDLDLQVIELPGESVFDTGHEIFHRSTESGLSCASCHPEGGDDGHTWNFAELGRRRTQALDVGLAGTEPFHWDGDMQDMNMLMGEVLAHRMGGSRQSEDRRDSFKAWLFAQERPPANPGLDDPTEVDLGRELFASYGCGTCHVGTGLGGSLTTEIRGESLQVPVLRRVSLRPPFMHDGRAATLEEAVRDMLLTANGIDSPLQADVEAMTAYMRSL